MPRAHGKHVDEALNAIRCPARVVVSGHKVDKSNAPTAAAHRDDGLVEGGRDNPLCIGANTANGELAAAQRLDGFVVSAHSKCRQARVHAAQHSVGRCSVRRRRAAQPGCG